MNILQHPGIDLSLKQLEKERGRIIKFNKRISKPGYKFKSTIKPNYPKYLNDLIELKQSGQLKLF